MSVTVLITRHGESDAYNKVDQDDAVILRQTRFSPLREPEGIIQAQLLGKQLSIYRPEVLITSPYVRARQTADYIAQYSPQLFPNVIDELGEVLREADGKDIYGDFNLKFKEWRGLAIRNGDLKSKFHPKDESFGELFSRATRMKHWIKKEFENQVVVVSSHSQFDAMFLGSCLLGDKPNPHALFDFFNRHFMSHAGYSILTWNHRKGWQMKPDEFNITKHLK